MKHIHSRVVFFLALAGWCIPTASAQPNPTMKLSIEWDKPVIQLGEVNHGRVWATIEPAFGTVVPWTTPPGTGQPGELKMFLSTIFDTSNVLNGTSGKLQWYQPGIFSIPGLPGVPDGQGGIANTNNGQKGPPVNPQPCLDNPILMLDLVWRATVPGEYSVVYQANPKSGKVALDVGLNGWVGQNAAYSSAGPAGFSVVLGQSVIEWSTPVDGHWIVDQNWSPAVVPNLPELSAILGGEGTYAVANDWDTVVAELWIKNPEASLSLYSNVFRVSTPRSATLANEGRIVFNAVSAGTTPTLAFD